ncbi:MAG: hypothetical protein IID32_03895 [Planctomycetes bacterium]|nr:hypothetical protein [Planctomycetota bacterium]
MNHAFPEGRRSVARGVSPWTAAPSNNKAPEGRQTASGSLSPLWGLAARSLASQGLAPLATNPGSSGAGTRNAHNIRNTGNVDREQSCGAGSAP